MERASRLQAALCLQLFSDKSPLLRLHSVQVLEDLLGLAIVADVENEVERQLVAWKVQLFSLLDFLLEECADQLLFL